MSKRRGERSTGRKLLVHLLLIVPTALSLLPFLWMLATSFKEPAELLGPMSFWPRKWTFENYVAAWNAAPFARYYINSVIVAACTVALQLVTGALAGYGFARVQMPGRDIPLRHHFGHHDGPKHRDFGAELSNPEQTRLARHVRRLDRPLGCDALQHLLVPPVFPHDPRDLEGAARIDGCSQLGVLWRIVLPLSKPAVLTVATYGWIGSWNDFLWPLVMTDSEHMRTLQVGLRVFTQDAGTRYTLQMAAAAFTIVPILIAYFFVQRQFVEGIARTGLTE